MRSKSLLTISQIGLNLNGSYLLHYFTAIIFISYIYIAIIVTLTLLLNYCAIFYKLKILPVKQIIKNREHDFMQIFEQLSYFSSEKLNQVLISFESYYVVDKIISSY